MLIPSAANAITFNVVVLPVDLLNVCNNYYCFPEASEILANDVVKYFNKTSKIKSPDLYEMRSVISLNQDLFDATASVVRKYDYNNTIDYPAVKKVAAKFDSKSVMLISSVVTANKGLSRRSVWEILEVSSAFDIEHPYILETNAVLIDTVNDIVMWSGNYTKEIGTKSKFTARNSAQANSKLDNVRLYFNDILSVDIAQNAILRFFPKTIEPLDRKPVDKSELYKDGSLLQFEKNMPKIKTDNAKEVSQEEMGEMIFGF